MDHCRYQQQSHCTLARCVGEYIPIGEWCYDRCWPNHPPAQLAMLRKRGFVVPDPPAGIDLLEWVQAKVADGTIGEQNQKTYTKKLPSIARMGLNLAGSTARVTSKLIADTAQRGLRAGLAGVWCCDEQLAERKAACDRCEHQGHDKHGHERCISIEHKMGCGCFLRKKRPLAGDRCKLGHWDEIDAKYTSQPPQRSPEP